MSTPDPRSERLARVRRRVAGGAVALFIASIGAVVVAGHQPVTKPTQGAATGPPRVIVYGDDGQIVTTSAAQGTAPLTSRTSGGTVVTAAPASTAPGAPAATTIIHLRDS